MNFCVAGVRPEIAGKYRHVLTRCVGSKSRDVRLMSNIYDRSHETNCCYAPAIYCAAPQNLVMVPRAAQITPLKSAKLLI